MASCIICGSSLLALIRTEIRTCEDGRGRAREGRLVEGGLHRHSAGARSRTRALNARTRRRTASGVRPSDDYASFTTRACTRSDAFRMAAWGRERAHGSTAGAEGAMYTPKTVSTGASCWRAGEIVRGACDAREKGAAAIPSVELPRLPSGDREHALRGLVARGSQQRGADVVRRRRGCATTRREARTTGACGVLVRPERAGHRAERAAGADRLAAVHAHGFRADGQALGAEVLRKGRGRRRVGEERFRACIAGVRAVLAVRVRVHVRVRVCVRVCDGRVEAGV
eukprot:1223863-Pleurochrysis_carterae.AAC.1